MLDDREVRILVALKQSDGATFTDLMEIAGLDPGRDLRGADLRGVNFAGCDLAGYDFSGAMLAGSSFRDALVEGAIFDRADLSAVRWPQGYAPEADGRIRRSRRPQLHARQLEIADALYKALRGGPLARAVAVLPPGVGKTTILSEVFSRLPNLKAFRRGLILTETIAERDQLVSSLRKWGVGTCDAREVERLGSIEAGLALVETFGNYTRLRADLDPQSDDHPNPFKCSHVAFTSLPTRRRSDIASIADGPSAPAALAFVESVVGARIEERLTRGKLGEIFGAVTFVYDVTQAVDDGLLTTSSFSDRTAVIARFRDRGVLPEDRVDAVFDVVVRDFLKELEGVGDADLAMMIVPDIENVELMVDELRSELRFAEPRAIRGATVFALTSRVRAAERQSALRTPGATIVTTPATADHLDLGQFAIVGTLAPIPPRLGAMLRNPPPSRDGKPLKVFDYAGTVKLMIEAVGRA